MPLLLEMMVVVPLVLWSGTMLQPALAPKPSAAVAGVSMTICEGISAWSQALARIPTDMWFASQENRNAESWEEAARQKRLVGA